MEIKTPAGLIAQYVKETLPVLVSSEAKNIESQIRIPIDGKDGTDGVGIEDVVFKGDYLTLQLTNGKKYKKLIPFKELDAKVFKELELTKSELLSWLKLNVRNGKDGRDGYDGNGIKNITIDKRGHLIIETDNKDYDLGLLKKTRVITKGGGGGSANAEFFYTNSLPMPNDVGGLRAGTTFNNMPLKELLNRLLYSTSSPNFTAFSIDGLNNYYEVGDVIPAGNYSADWAIVNTDLLAENSIKITYVNAATVLAENLPNTPPHVIALPEITYDAYSEVNFRITALDTTGEEFGFDYGLKFMHRIYFGESNLEELTDIDIKGLRVSLLRQNVNGDFVMQAGGYKWICYPASMGVRDTFEDVNAGFDVAMDDVREVTLINDFGVEILYYCYRTYNILGGAITIRVSG